MKFKLLAAFLLVLAFLSSTPVLAKKKISRQATDVSVPKHKLRADHQALLLVLSNMDKAQSVAYKLIYTADSIPQGVEGTYDAASGNTQKELLFGTCSKNICTYHQNITDMILELRTSLKTGKTLVQKYQIKP